ncbi:MAG: hypothetical protein IKT50_00710, partial [Clostridia bacterium]|nr:hypothetical protein [Clostridia bacterium]
MLQAGFARVDVTPPLGTVLTGYFAPRISDGVFDPIELNALALRVEEDSVLVITGDFMYTLEKDVTHYRDLISKETGLPADHIFYQSIHQHTSTTPGTCGPSGHLYQEYLCRKFADVAKMALADLSDTRISIGEKKTAEPVSFVRRYIMKDGSVQTNPGRLNPDVDRPLYDADNTVRLVKLEREGKEAIAVVGFQTHPDMIGGNKISADWPGFVRRITEKTFPDTHCILINGCQGEVNHINVFKAAPTKGIEKYTPAFYEAKYEFCREFAQIIVDAVSEIWDRTEEIGVDRIFSKVDMKLIPSKIEGLERINECKEIMARVVAGEKPLEGLTMGEKADIRRIAAMDQLMLMQKVPVSVVAFGKIAIVGYGGEPFTEYAIKVREAFPELFVLTACLANGAQGYLPSAAAFEEGGYEAAASNFSPAVAPVLQ